MQNKQNIVDDHRNMLMLSKNISEFQENNLKTWSFIFLEGVDTVKVSWNFIDNNENKDFFPGEVTFDVTFKEGAGPETDFENIQTGFEKLVAATKFLFWSETEVIIKQNGTKWTTNL